MMPMGSRSALFFTGRIIAILLVLTLRFSVSALAQKDGHPKATKSAIPGSAAKVQPASGTVPSSFDSQRYPLDRLHDEIQKLELTQCDPATPPVVRELNMRMIAHRQDEIVPLLQQRIAELNAYAAQSGIALSSDDRQELDSVLKPLEAELNATLHHATASCSKLEKVANPSPSNQQSQPRPSAQTRTQASPPADTPDPASHGQPAVDAAPADDNSAQKPQIIKIAPATATSGGDAFQLTVTGLNLGPNAVVLWNGKQRPTSAKTNDTTALTAEIAAEDIAQAGQVSITVLNSKAKLVSDPVALNVLLPKATLKSIDPSDIPAGAGGVDIDLRLSGTNFLPDTCGAAVAAPAGCSKATQVFWNGEPISSHYVGPAQLQVTINSNMRKRDATVSLTVMNSGSGQTVSDPQTLVIHDPVPIAGGTFTHRAIVGTDISGASSLPTQQKVFFEFNLDAPLRFSKAPQRYVCPGPETDRTYDMSKCDADKLYLNPKYIQDQDPLNHRWWLWANSRISSLPQQSGSVLNSSNVQSSSDFLNSLISSNLNKVVQGFEFLSGVELTLFRPRPAVPFPFVAGHSRLSASFIVAGGAITPFAVPDINQQEFVATTAGLTRFGAPSGSQLCNPNANPPITTGCFNDIAFVTPDRSRFYRQYYAGFRFKTWYFLDSGPNNDSKAKCFHGESFTPNDLCKQFPGVFDVLFGQNESVSGGTLHGSVVRFDGYYPIPSIPGFYIYGTAILRVARSQASGDNQTPIALTLEGHPLPLSDPTVFLVNDPGIGRDFFRIGVGVDLIHLINGLKKPKPPVDQNKESEKTTKPPA
jgi:hypothetical protein